MRSAAKAGSERFADVGAIKQARRVLDELKHRRTSIDEGAMGAAIAHTPGVSAATVRIHDGRVGVDATFEDGESRVLAVVPESVRFAPRGAKEVIFRIEPPEAVNDARARELVGSLAASMARALWGPVLGPREGDEQALVEREGARLRADLRSVPAVRAALEGPLGMALDVLAIERFGVEDGRLSLELALPFPTP